MLSEIKSVLDQTELEESIKWGAPCYTIDGKNVVGLGAFKEHLAIWFFQGVFLKDAGKVLVNAQEGTTKGLRQWRFVEGDSLDHKLILKYVQEAIANQKAGKEIKIEKKTTTSLPTELSQALKKDKSLSACFKTLTPGKQREYAEYISTAKQEKTRLSRIEKIKPLILEKKGLNDKYRKC